VYILAAAMTWIRSPWWDGFWILSGPPIGVVLMLFIPGMVLPLGIAVMVLESAHVVSPVLLAWTRPELRMIVSREWIRHIVLPMLIMATVLTAPADAVFGFYFAWNVYHFGMQNFGVMSLYLRGGSYDKRIRRSLICLAGTALFMAILPALFPAEFRFDFHYGSTSPPLGILCFAVLSFNHWLVDVGLSSRVARWHWGFIVLVLAVGVVWLVLRNGPLSVQLVPQILVIRAGIGMVHFVYSARIWKLSDRKVRAVIGKHICRLESGSVR
jgi:hypothetical protein